jgi:hypothetical protein
MLVGHFRLGELLAPFHGRGGNIRGDVADDCDERHRDVGGGHFHCNLIN